MPPAHHQTPRPMQAVSHDDDSTPMPQSACSSPDGCPMAERVSRLERTADSHTRELGKGAVMMTRLEGNMDRLTDSVDRLEKTLDRFQLKVETRAEKPNRYLEMAISAAIQWGIPLLGIAAIWAVVKSGAVAVHP